MTLIQVNLALTTEEITELENALLVRAVNLQRAVQCSLNDRYKVALKSLADKFLDATPVETIKEAIRGALQA